MTTHVFDTMGTTVSLRVPGRLPAAGVLHDVEHAFAQVDRRFSLYRADSALSRVARGELALHRSSRMLRDRYAEALEWSRRTGGAFTPHRPDGVIDLSGLVKADAIAAAGDILDAAGTAAWLLNAGGDILARGRFGGEGIDARTREGGTRDAPWPLGIVDPDARGGLLCVVELAGTRRALATSGTAERGEHIWRASSTAQGQSRFRQVSVVADDIITADVLATAILAGGYGSRDDILDRFDVDALTVDDRGHVTATRGLRIAAGLVPA